MFSFKLMVKKKREKGGGDESVAFRAVETWKQQKDVEENTFVSERESQKQSDIEEVKR